MSDNDAAMAAAAAAFAEAHAVGFLGPLLLAAFVGTFFSGLLAMQVATYFRCFRKDNVWLKRLVFSTILLSILQLVLSFYTSWLYFVTGFGNWAIVGSINGVTASLPVISQLTISLAQTYFVYRSFILTERHRPLLIFLVFGVISSLGLYTGLGVDLAIHPYSVELHNIILLVALGITIATDVAITGVTTWKLLSSRRGVNASTDSGLAKLLRVTWEAAVPPAIVAVVNLIAVLTVGNETLLYSLFNVLVPRLYVFSLMFTLNSRPDIRMVFESTVTNSHEMSSDIFRSHQSSTHGSKLSKPPKPRTTSTVVFARMGPGGEPVEGPPTATLGEIPDGMGGSGRRRMSQYKDSPPNLSPNMDQHSWGKEEGVSDTGTIRTMDGDREPKAPPMLTTPHFV